MTGRRPRWPWLLLVRTAMAERPHQRQVALDTQRGFHENLLHLGAENDTDDAKKEAFSYPKLNEKIKQLEKESGEYADQVKGPMMDQADIWLQKKLRYEDSANVLSKGMGVERQLLHKLRVEVKNNGTKKLKEMEEHLKDVEDGPSANNSNETIVTNATTK